MSRRNRIILIGMVIGYWTGHTMLRTILAPRLSDAGLPSWLLALIVAMNAFPGLILAIPTGFVSDRIGFGPMMVSGSACMLGGSVLLAATDVPALLIVSQVFMGFGALQLWMAIQGIMIAGARAETGATETGATDTDATDTDATDTAATEARAADASAAEHHARLNRRVASYSVYGGIGQLLGPLAGGLVAGGLGYRGAFLVLCVVTTATFLAALTRPAAALDAEAAAARAAFAGRLDGRAVAGSYGMALRLVGGSGFLFSVLVSFCALYLSDLRASFQPLYLHSIEMPAAVAGVLLASGNAAGLVAPLLLPVLLAKVRSGTAAVLCIVPSAIATAGIAFTRNVPLLLVLCVLGGLGTGIAAALTLRLTADHTRASERGVGIGVRLVANRAATWCSPLIFGAVLVMSNIGVAFVAAAGIAAGLALPAGLALNRRTGWPRPRPAG
jgi:MFS family permease